MTSSSPGFPALQFPVMCSVHATTLRFGADRLTDDQRLLGAVRRAGLITNDAARLATNASVRSRQALCDAGIPIVRLFSPEHGLQAAAADGAAVGDGVDPLTGLPVVSLYGERFAPPPESLADLDTLLFDIPDVGARFYTYTWTLTHAIDACAAAGKSVIVLDRPNPLSGQLHLAEGPLLEPVHFSFVGRHDIPIRHSLTLGEVARLWQQERCPQADVRVITCDGWQRTMFWPDTGLPFVPTSPAINEFASALLFPCLCVFEATNLSVGRGTAKSFQAVGAPWLDATRLIERFNARATGVTLDPIEFTPSVGPWAHLSCHGVLLSVDDVHAFRPVAAGLALVADIIATHPKDFCWAAYPTAANPAGTGHFERLMGSASLKHALEHDADSLSDKQIRAWTGVGSWPERWQSCVLG